jgi:probable phosphoglycerate mutase
MATLNRVIGGPKGDLGLSPLGREQATKLRLRLERTAEVQPDVVASSVLPRAMETAQLVFPEADVVTDCDWCELHPGECDGLVWDDYVSRYDTGPPDPERPMSPGGESTRTFDERVRRAIDALIARYEGKTVVLFTHGGFVSAAVHKLVGGPGMHVPGPLFLDPDNTSITSYRRTDDGDRWILERYNDSAHLQLL